MQNHLVAKCIGYDTWDPDTGYRVSLVGDFSSRTGEIWVSERGRGRKTEEKADSSKDLNKKLKVFWLVASALEFVGAGGSEREASEKQRNGRFQ